MTEEQKRELFYLVFDVDGPELEVEAAAARIGITEDEANALIAGWSA
jgi:hypothetical protein